MKIIIDHLIDLVSRAGHWSYLIIAAVVMLECQAILGFFIPGESLVLVGGFLASRGLLDLDALIVVVSIGAIVGDSIGYEVGRRVGTERLLRYGRWAGLNQEKLDRVADFLKRPGGKSVFAGHFLHLLRALMPFVAGSQRMSYWRFLFFNSLGCILWSSIFVLLGYGLGESWKAAERWIGRASAIVGGVIVLFFLLSWLWRWVIRHEAGMKQSWASFLEQSRVATFRRRFASQIRFLQERFSPKGYLGLHLTVGIVILIAASWLFGGIAEDVVTGDPIVQVDHKVAVWFSEHATPGLDALITVVTYLGSSVVIVPLSGALAIYLLWRRYWYRLLALILVVPCGMMLTILFKTAFHRQRPTLAIQSFTTYSFPSGHATAATLFYGLLGFFLLTQIKSWRGRVSTILITLFLVFLVDFTRVYLRVHYLSDVLAADAFGLAWLALCLAGVEILKRYKDESRASV